jgi:hypothetical protein
VGSTNDITNFPYCTLEDPIELNKGTKFSTLMIEFTAYRNPASTGTRTLWNTSA